MGAKCKKRLESERWTMLILWRWEWIRPDDRWDLRPGDVDQLQRLQRIYPPLMSRSTRTLCKCWCWWRCWYCWWCWVSWYCREYIHQPVTLNENFVQMSRWYCGYFGYNNPTNTMVRLPRTLCKSWFFLNCSLKHLRDILYHWAYAFCVNIHLFR